MTCLSIIQSVCLRVGLPKPNSAVTSTDSKIQQLVELSNEEGQELAARYQWQALTDTATFLTQATSVQLDFFNFTSNVYFTANPKFIVNNTIWNTSTRLPIYGSLSAQEWEMLTASYITGPYIRYRIFNNQLNFIPIPPADQECIFQYVTDKWVGTYISGLPGPRSTVWTTDQDVGYLDESVMALGVIWRWKAAKGLAYAQDYDKYEKRVSDLMARDGTKPKLKLGGEYEGIQPIVMVSAGSWPV